MIGRLLKIGFWVAVAVITLLALVPQPPQVGPLTSDKLQHLLAFAALSVGALLAYPQVAQVRLVLALAAYGAAIEIVQLVPALHRSSDVLDWLVDVATVAVVLPAAGFVLRQWRGRRPDR